VSVGGAVDSRVELEIRTSPRAGDVEAIIELHRALYRAEDGFGPLFVRYVAEGMTEFRRAYDGDTGAGRLWLVESGGDVRGSIAIVRGSPAAAQLRWFLLAPELRGRGLGRRLVDEALSYARSEGYPSIFLWTVRGLDAAAKLYRAAGFELAEERAGTPWGEEVVEQRYELTLA
jgi:GNAT superfamily N-acetyltransferase